MAKILRIDEEHFDNVIFVLNDCYVRQSCNSCPMYHRTDVKRCLIDHQLLQEDKEYAQRVFSILQTSHERAIAREKVNPNLLNLKLFEE